MAYATLYPANFRDIDIELGERRSMPLALNTVAYRTKSKIVISYHGNDIAVYDMTNQSITLTTSGWVTPTTIDRLHQIALRNGLGKVGIVRGRARFTSAIDKGWYHMEDQVVIERDGKVSHDDKDRYRGCSNADTYHAFALATNPIGGENEYKAILKMSRKDLREWVKSNRREIGYSSIANVNFVEIYYSLKEV